MTPNVTLRRALTDPALLGPALGGETWRAWRVLLVAMMGEALEPAELPIFTALTGRTTPPDERVDEAWIVAGRRGGKSRAMSALAVYLSCLVDWTDRLAIGERGTMMLLAPDTKQSSLLLGYCAGMIEASPLLAGLIVNRTSDTLELRSGITLEVRSSNFRRMRGVTCIAVLIDEIAFLQSEGANPDSEVLTAARPSLVTTSGPLLAISSPFGKRGELYEVHRRHFGEHGDAAILVAQGGSRDFNPGLSEAIVTRAMQRDPASAKAEFLGLFRDDVQSFISPEAVAAATAQGVAERMPVPGITYYAGLDPSGGVKDSFALAIAHVEKIEGQDVGVLDMLREHRAPFVPADVVASIARDMKRYGCRDGRMDRYAAQWPEQEFRRHGITTRPTDNDRSGLYLNLLPALNSGHVVLLDSARLTSQLTGLERRTGRNRDVVDHPQNGADDVANAAAIALGAALWKPRFEEPRICGPIVHGDGPGLMFM